MPTIEISTEELGAALQRAANTAYDRHALIGAKDAGIILGFPPRTASIRFRELAERNKIPAHDLGERSMRYMLADVIAYRDSLKIK